MKINTNVPTAPQATGRTKPQRIQKKNILHFMKRCFFFNNVFNTCMNL